MKKIHLVSYAGPEWNDPIQAFCSNKKANDFVKEKNKTLDKTKPYDRLSTYTVSEIPFDDN